MKESAEQPKRAESVSEEREGSLRVDTIVVRTPEERKRATDRLLASTKDWTYARWISNSIEGDDRKELVGVKSADFLISSIDATPKRADMHQPCVGGVVVGEGSNGKDVSFIFHVRARAARSPQFQRALRRMLGELRGTTKEGTRAVRLYGGMLRSAERPTDETERINVTALDDADYEMYARSVEETGKVVQEELGFDPVVATPPSDGYSQGQDAFLVGRNLTILHPGSAGESFLSSQVRETPRTTV